FGGLQENPRAIHGADSDGVAGDEVIGAAGHPHVFRCDITCRRETSPHKVMAAADADSSRSEYLRSGAIRAHVIADDEAVGRPQADTPVHNISFLRRQPADLVEWLPGIDSNVAAERRGSGGVETKRIADDFVVRAARVADQNAAAVRATDDQVPLHVIGGSATVDRNIKVARIGKLDLAGSIGPDIVADDPILVILTARANNVDV